MCETKASVFSAVSEWVGRDSASLLAVKLHEHSGTEMVFDVDLETDEEKNVPGVLLEWSVF